MYTIVLAMALAGTADTPACCWSNCFGCNGWGNSWGGCSGCYGGGYSYGGCNGGYYNGGCNGGGYYGGYGVYNAQPAPTPMPQAPEKVAEPKKGKDQARVSTPATIIVSVPANAKLTIDGSYVTQQTSSQRVLLTPPMLPGQEFTYTLVAENTQDGQTVSQTQRITVRPGQQLPVNFTLSTAPTAASD